MFQVSTFLPFANSLSVSITRLFVLKYLNKSISIKLKQMSEANVANLRREMRILSKGISFVRRKIAPVNLATIAGERCSSFKVFLFVRQSSYHRADTKQRDENISV